MKAAPPPPAPQAVAPEALPRGEERARLISALVRFILHEEQEEARARRVREVRR